MIFCSQFEVEFFVFCQERNASENRACLYRSLFCKDNSVLESY